VVAVGTTTVRALEAASQGGELKPGAGWTDIFLYPPYRLKTVDGLITNFHFPRSTLLMLVSCLVPRELLLAAYSQAVERRYRFYSFGDAMLII
jgi:S-adenosylmethionine:tRNA ribosyltransferase-isomerase